ncbi:molybdenum cofactor biosynthesis protein B [Aeromicrobium sp. Leaf350]|uniref:MogA/MoaB family molybdenum cofactor biosynthesis protein n=1 Tax=Aeromicrobium sp. Leaf350 TaxID=2876565 RepID=UPI001E62DC2B|nr:MogA/MoaB family molybdenum cofactor biosynthesis protein [Aeromicrobium sp. Leaf350]
MTQPAPRAAVITVSDRASAGTADDRSGPLAVEAVVAAGFDCAAAVVVPDGAEQVEHALRDAIASGARLVVTTGGTGVGPRDATPEGTARVLTRLVPGIVEEIRRLATLETPGGMLSRGLAGVVDGPGGSSALVVNLPGSTAAVRSAMPVLLSVASHVVSQLDGGDH